MIIYYDGVCNLCFGFVSMVNRYSKPGTFSFEPLQGSMPESIPGSMDSVIVRTSNNELLQKSDAVRLILQHMYWPFRMLNYMILLFPKKIRNSIYDLIARNRYKWFGKKNECQILK